MKSLIFPALALLILASCKKETASAPASMVMKEYYPLEVGKFVTYRLDSTVFISLNTIKVIRTYVVKDLVDYKFKDNTGNDVFRIRRTMRSNQDTSLWLDNATFLVTQTENKTDFTENNLRFIKLINPVSLTSSWNGNSYINVRDDFLSFYEGWEYYYETVGEPFTVGGRTYSQTVTVNQANNVDGDTTNFNIRHEITRSKEVYAKGIGLVYRDFYHALWQPVLRAYEPNSYGVRLTLLNHN